MVIGASIVVLEDADSTEDLEVMVSIAGLEDADSIGDLEVEDSIVVLEDADSIVALEVAAPSGFATVALASFLSIRFFLSRISPARTITSRINMHKRTMCSVCTIIT